MHLPVLLNEVLEWLQPKPGGSVVDGTAGSGGHSVPIIERLAPNGIFVGIDWDEAAIKNLESRLRLHFAQAPRGEQGYGGQARSGRLILRVGNYADIPEILEKEKIRKVDGILLDLGFSSEQLEAGKGFSFTKDELLVMTYSKDRLPAYRALMQLGKSELTEIIKTYGEERYAVSIARAIWERERKQPIKTSGELTEVIHRAVPSSYGRGKIDPATRTFMALRIYLNDELGNLEKFLKVVPEVMAKKGRVVVISFHSLEDRLVKNRFRELAGEKKARLLSKKPIIPTKEEIRVNPRSRSAKLRAIEIL